MPLTLSVASELWTRSSSSPLTISSASTLDRFCASSAFSDSRASSWELSASLDCGEETESVTVRASVSGGRKTQREDKAAQLGCQGAASHPGCAQQEVSSMTGSGLCEFNIVQL